MILATVLLIIFFAVILVVLLFPRAEKEPRAGAPGSKGALLNQGIEELHPAYFACVMSTGIVSIAAHYQGLPAFSQGLFRLNIFLYGFLWVLYVWRMVRYPDRFRRDFLDHLLGFGYFTIVAATGVLGSQAILLGEMVTFASALWCLTVSLWVCLIYGIFTGLITKEEKPGIAEGINGGWLLSIVATQAVTVLSTALSPHLFQYRDAMLFFAFIAWLFGGMLYIWVISLIFYRYMFFHFSPRDLTPPYWINMGAVAISTLGGTGLIANALPGSFLYEMLPFLKGLTFFFWATATWWIPMLVVLGVWRHLYRRFPLAYHPLFWGMVFPLGMYTTCTHRLAAVTDAPMIAGIAPVMVWAAVGAWLVTFGGMLHAVYRAAFAPAQ